MKKNALSEKNVKEDSARNVSGKQNKKVSNKLVVANKKRRNKIVSFIDKDHHVMHDYYTIFDGDLTDNQVLKKMQTLIKADPDFLDPYLVASEILFSRKRDVVASALIKEAYARALATIVDLKGNWPKEMLWGYLANRHIMRAIEAYALLCWEDGYLNEALDIFRRLLRVNPYDNQGMRYNILAIRKGLNFEKWKKPFICKRDGEILGLDAFKMTRWFNENAKNFPEEFPWIAKNSQEEE